MKTIYYLSLVTWLLTACTADIEVQKPIKQAPTSEYKVSAEEASDIALNFATQLATPTTRMSQPKRVANVQALRNTQVQTRGNTTGTAGLDTLLYVVNFADNQGYALIAADKRTTPIFAVIDEGNYNPEQLTSEENEGFLMFLDNALETEVSDILNYDPNTEVRMPQTDKAWTIITAIPPLLKTKWDQGDVSSPDGYGRFCPNKVAGCVITAAAQIMAYHQADSVFHPRREHQGYYTQPIHVNWERIMSDCKNNNGRIDPYYHRESMEEVANLYYYLGRLFNASYNFDKDPSKNSTSAKGDAPIKWFIRHGAGLSATKYKKYNEGDVIRGIKEGNPVYATGSAIAEKRFLRKTKHHGNHAWVYDGYIRASNSGKEHDLLHCNWGWDGNKNGYYLGRFFDTTNGPKISADSVATRNSDLLYFRTNFMYSIISR